MTSQNVPQPYGPIPSPRQLRWHSLEVYGFLHFTVNTFTDKEWGYGDESPQVFCPTDFDADQMAATRGRRRAQGADPHLQAPRRLLPLALPLHRAFRQEQPVARWTGRCRGGSGGGMSPPRAAVRRLSLAVGSQRGGLRHARPTSRITAASCASCWKPTARSSRSGSTARTAATASMAAHGRPASIDRRTYYDWDETWQIVRDLQPDACMFSDAGPDVRWVGNERGVAGETCWATLNRDDFVPGEADHARLNTGDRPGTHWLPAECDVSIRPGWFYHAAEDEQRQIGRPVGRSLFQVGRTRRVVPAQPAARSPRPDPSDRHPQPHRVQPSRRADLRAQPGPGRVRRGRPDARR